MIPRAGEAPTTPATPRGFAEFRQVVFDNPTLQTELMQAANREAFIALALRLGSEHCWDFSAGDVESALRAARLAQIERWI